MEPIRPPDSTRKDCLLGSPVRTVRRRRRRASDTDMNDNAVITWDETPPSPPALPLPPTPPPPPPSPPLPLSRYEEEDEEALFQRAMEESLQEEERRQRREASEQKFGLVRSRLRLIRHPSDPLVDIWLELLEKECTPNHSSSSLVTDEQKEELRAWLEKRQRNSPLLSVLADLL